VKTIDPIDQNSIDPNLLNVSCFNENRRAGSLARLGHLLDVQKVAGSSPVRPTIYCFCSVELRLFLSETVENCVISCFKRSSNVLDKLKPRLRVFSTNSLSRYDMTSAFFLD
jgi:hypothetical protein